MSQSFVESTGESYSFLKKHRMSKKDRISLKITVDSLHCCVCEQGLEDGVSITAKRIGRKVHFFCGIHFPE